MPYRAVDEIELRHLCGLAAAEIDELVDYGALVPLHPSTQGARQFSAECLEPLQEAARLRRDFDLDLFAVGLLLGYLMRIERLEERIRSLHAHLPHSLQADREGPTPWREPHG